MSQKNQIWLLAGTTVVLAGTTAYFGYKNYSLKNQLATWYKAQEASVRNSLPQEVREILEKVNG